MQPLQKVHNPQLLRSVVNNVVQDYYPAKALLSAILLVPAVSEGKTASEAVVDLVGRAWTGLSNIPSDFFSRSDRRIILDLMRMQTEQAELADSVPLENRPALYSAVLDSFWSIQKMDLCFASIAAIYYRDIEPHESRLTHWLCLAIRHYLDDWYSSLFANNPVLKDRLSKPLHELNTISLEEWEREIGL